MIEENNNTPILNQYYSIKAKHPDHIVFFQVGDFYETFNQDAQDMSSLLGLILTRRGTTPMAGIPVHTLQFYLRKLILEHDRIIAVCNQTETPEEAKKSGRSLVNREVEQIISPGTFIDLQDAENNFVLSIVEDDQNLILAYGDLSTSECLVEKIIPEQLTTFMEKICPREIVHSCNNIQIPEAHIRQDINSNQFFSSHMPTNRAINLLIDFFQERGFVFKPHVYNIQQETMKFGKNTLLNLEILESNSVVKKNSLLSLLNFTQTPMGFRRLKYNLVRPLLEVNHIEKRLQTIQNFIDHLSRGNKLVFNISDITKLVQRLKTPAEVIKLGSNLEQALTVLQICEKMLPFDLYGEMHNIKITVHKTINEEMQDCELGYGVFKNSQKIIDLKKKYTDLIEEIYNLPQQLHIDAAIRENSTIGFFFEVKKGLSLGNQFLLRQTMTNVNRYTHARMLELEANTKNLKEYIIQEEKMLLDQVLKRIEEEKDSIESLANLIGWCDYFLSCAKAAMQYNYHRPTFQSEFGLKITDGRHPIIEQNLDHFATNNTHFSTGKYHAIITGPNMGGKSTYLRQIAIILIMAQVGMFVPAKLQTSIFHNVFVRLGAGDDLNAGNSTFMTEMLECAEILNEQKHNSLIIIDEIGRGTSTIDGLSIAMAICEWLNERKNTISFISTHYHELALCESYLASFINLYTTYEFTDNKLYLLYQIKPGIASESFGIKAAELAGLPLEIIQRSQKIRELISVQIALPKYFSNVKNK